MRVKSITLKLISLIATAMILFGCINNKRADRKSQLAGMYKLYIMENQDALGNWQMERWGKEGTGYIVYDGLGHMAVQITPKGYRDFVWMNEEDAINDDKLHQKIESMSQEELKDALAEFSSSYVYIANYSVDDTADIVLHDRISSTLPVIWDTKVKRKFSFSGDTLILQILNGNRRLKWIKQP